MYVGTWAASHGHVQERRADSAHPSIVPFQAFESADGWLTVACAKEKFWLRLCEAIARPDLLADPRYADFAGRDRHREPLLAELRSIFRTERTDTWLERLGAAGVPVGRVNDVAEALTDPQTVARQSVVEVDHPTLGKVREIASPLRLSGHAPSPARGPFRGEHTDAVLREVCGYDDQRIEELRAAAVFGGEARTVSDAT
jgi:crotonobetainyl-CoA:carnitine CoA-transferase CaiB-like acyl-CoA transferase